MFRCYLQKDADPVCYGVGVTAKGAIKAGVRAWCLQNGVTYVTRDHDALYERVIREGYLVMVDHSQSKP
jgi:hypothetical protein